jgi:hypothetical protein
MDKLVFIIHTHMYKNESQKKSYNLPLPFQFLIEIFSNGLICIPLKILGLNFSSSETSVVTAHLYTLKIHFA